MLVSITINKGLFVNRVIKEGGGRGFDQRGFARRDQLVPFIAILIVPKRNNFVQYKLVSLTWPEPEQSETAATCMCALQFQSGASLEYPFENHGSITMPALYKQMSEEVGILAIGLIREAITRNKS